MNNNGELNRRDVLKKGVVLGGLLGISTVAIKADEVAKIPKELGPILNLSKETSLCSDPLIIIEGKTKDCIIETVYGPLVATNNFSTEEYTIECIMEFAKPPIVVKLNYSLHEKTGSLRIENAPIN